MHWAGAMERHRDGGVHYHCALHLSGIKKWQSFEKSHNVILNFSDSHDFYVTAYHYICKSSTVPDIRTCVRQGQKDVQWQTVRKLRRDENQQTTKVDRLHPPVLNPRHTD